jgi:osmotically-inducible protein OsmY
MDDTDLVSEATTGGPADVAIAEAVQRELREDALTTDLPIRIVVRAGVVSLRGVVPSLELAEAAEEVAARVEGVTEVVDELEVQGLT